MCTNFWVQRMEQHLSVLPNYKVVIDDIRFPDEADMVRRLGGQVVHLKRTFKTITQRTTPKKLKNGKM